MLAIHSHLYYTDLYRREQHLYFHFLVHGSVNSMNNTPGDIKVWYMQEAAGSECCPGQGDLRAAGVPVG